MDLALHYFFTYGGIACVAYGIYAIIRFATYAVNDLEKM